MIDNFGFVLPTEISFGRGVSEELGQRVIGFESKSPMFVADKGVIQAGLLSSLEKQLNYNHIKYEIFSDTVPNPRDRDCDEGAKYAKSKGVDLLIAVGGGSAMDTAKAIATVMTNGKTTRDWFDVELDVNSAPVICIPTTCGTGSEVTYNAVITNSETKLKANIFDPKCAPVLALVDPVFLQNLPNHLIGSTGMDALTHAIEAYVCKVATPVTDAIAKEAIVYIKNNIIKATKEKNKDALDELMLGSMLAGIAFGNADTAGVHCIAECFGGFYDMPHGVTNAIFLSAVSEFSIPGNPKKYKEVARLLGADVQGLSDEDGAMEGIKIIDDLSNELGIPSLSSFEEVSAKDFDYLANASSEHVCNPNNPIEGTKDDYLNIFNKVLAK